MLYIPLSVNPDCKISAQSLKFSSSPSGTLEISGGERPLFTDSNLMGFAGVAMSAEHAHIVSEV